MTAVRVAVDAMGGDRAPEEIVAGALAAASADVGPSSSARATSRAAAGGLELVQPTRSSPCTRSRPRPFARSPTARCSPPCRAVGRGNADAVVSAGNTGAMLAAGLLEIRRLPDVIGRRSPFLIPARGGPSS